MLDYLVISWMWFDPQNRDSSECSTWDEADSLARAVAQEGYEVVVYRLESSCMGADLCAINGVRSGADIPATLHPSARRLVA